MPRGRDQTPAEQGLPEGKALELILSKAYRRTDARLWQGGIGPALDRQRPVSQNIPVVAAVCQYLLGGSPGWLVAYCLAQLMPGAGGTGLSGREGGRGQYVAYTITAIRAALREAERRGDAASAGVFRRWLAAQLMWCALGAVPWPVAPEEQLSPDLTVLGVGDRCQGHYLGPLTMLVADAIGRRVHSKWRRALPDPRLLLSDDPQDVRGLQVHAWPWRVWCLAGAGAGVLGDDSRDALGDLVQDGAIDRVSATVVLERALHDIVLRAPWQVWRWERAHASLMGRSIGNLSTPAFGVASSPAGADWLDPYAAAGLDIRKGIQHGEASAEFADGKLRMQASIPAAGLTDQVELDTAGAGRLLYHLTWEPDRPALAA